MKGMFLEGAKWDYEHGYLAEPNPMELFSPMPIVHFKPAMAKKKATKRYLSMSLLYVSYP